MMRLLLPLSLLAVAAGCAHGVSDEVESAPIVTYGAPAPDLVGRAEQDRPRHAPSAFATTTQAAAKPFVCRINSLCEDFEGPPAAWHQSVGLLEPLHDPASAGKGAVRVQGSDAAYLSYVHPDVVGVRWAGAFFSTIKLDVLDGPVRGRSLHVVRDDGTNVDVSLSIGPAGIVLSQETTACPTTMSICGARRDLVADALPMGAWHKLALGIEIGGDPPLGRVSVRLNDGDEIVRPLDVPLFEGHLDYRAGLVSTAPAPVSFDMDDVWLFVLP